MSAHHYSKTIATLNKYLRATLKQVTSIYLDFFRLFAALLVFFYHASAERLNGQSLIGIASFGHDAIIVFFVLSGFVIAYITDCKSTDIGGFIKNRLARL